ncbi:RNA-directed DNA polymerase, reverse transcriptase-related family protein [Tanacetum coccineum]
MVFVGGDKRSIEGALAIFDDFAIHSGLRISLEKSTIYMAGIKDDVKEDILTDFPFKYGKLPVRYLGLPLLTKKMKAADFAPLIEKIKLQISTWTARQLSFAGRPDLKTTKAKVSWKVVCTPKEEGGLGLKSLEDVNKVCVLKLIFRIISSKNSLWVDWIKRHLIRNNSLWALKDNMIAGSWICKKLLKYRDMARLFYKVEVKCGYSVSFWHDSWCSLGCLIGLFGSRGFIELGVSEQTTLGEVMERDRRRIHQNVLLNQGEREILMLKEQRVYGQEDGFLWRLKDDTYSDRFRSKETWQILRGSLPTWECHRGIWFPFATSKFAFLSWLAAKNRLATGEKMECWNINVRIGCSFCAEPKETREHLFFDCPYSRQIWEALVGGLMGSQFTWEWTNILNQISRDERTMNLFIVRYAFQATIHSLWIERNRRRHGEKPIPNTNLVRTIDVMMRNRFSTMRKNGDKKDEDGIHI